MKISLDYLEKEKISEKELLNQFHMDIASSIQSVTEDLVIVSLSYFKRTKIKNLCMAGGVAQLLLTVNYYKKFFDNIWFQPAAGDAGGSLGALAFGIFN